MIKRDGVTKDPNAWKRRKLEKEAMRRECHKLRQNGVECEVRESKAIIGKYKGEPFCVYMKWLINAEGEFAGMLTTRYKGKDTECKTPQSVLRA